MFIQSWKWFSYTNEADVRILMRGCTHDAGAGLNIVHLVAI